MLAGAFVTLKEFLSYKFLAFFFGKKYLKCEGFLVDAVFLFLLMGVFFVGLNFVVVVVFFSMEISAGTFLHQ